MNLNEYLTSVEFEDDALTDGDLPVEVVVAVRMVDADSGDSYLFYTSSEGANTYSLRGMLEEAADIEKCVTVSSWFEGEGE